MSIESRKLSILPLWPYAPGWWRRLFTGAIDRVFFQHAHAFLDRSFELRIVPGDYVFGPILNIDVRRNAFVFNCPTIDAREETAARGDCRAAIDKRRRVRGMDQPAPGAFADQPTDFSVMKHVGHQVAAGTGHLVNDHYLRSPDSG